MRLLVASVSALAVAGPAMAADPKAIELNAAVQGRVAKGELDCYQIDAPKGATLSVGVDPQGFAPNVQVLRGARCDADVPQFEVDGTANGGADLPFKSVGGRYLVVVRAKSGAGAYRLKISNSTQVAEKAPAKEAPSKSAPPAAAGVAPPADLAAAITAGMSKEEADKLIGGVETAAVAEKPVDPKVALMRKQLAGYKEEQERERLRREEEARQAEEARIRREAEEEERREMQRQQRAEDEANRQAMWGTILQGIQTVGNAYVEAKQQRFDAQQRLNQLARERDAANAAKAERERQEKRDAEEAQQKQIRANFAAKLGEANAQREAMLARTTDPAQRAKLEAYNQKAQEIARQYGVESEFQKAHAAAGGLTVAGPARQQTAALSPQEQAQKRAQAETAQREKDKAEAEESARKRNEAIAKANADREKMLADQRKAQEEARKKQEEMQKRMQAQMLLNQHARGGMSTVGLGPVDKGATPPGGGSLSRGVSNVGQCKASNVEVRYNFGVIMGEPTVSGSWSFSGEDGCSPPHNTVAWVKVQNGTAYGWVRLDPAVPTANRGFGYNSTGSPSWGQLLCSFSGSGPSGCMNEAQARALWANGQVTDFVMGW